MGDDENHTEEVIDDETEDTSVEDDSTDTSKNDGDDTDADNQGDDGEDTKGGEEDDKEGDDKKEPKDKDSKNATDKDSKDDAEPPIRKNSNAAFVKARQAAKAAKDAKNNGAKGADDTGLNGDDDLDIPDKTSIERMIDERVAPVVEKAMREEENAEINSFLAEHPDMKPYETKVRKYWAHESRQHLPVSSVFYEVAGPDLLRLGAQRQKKADIEAKKSNAGGGDSGRGNGGEKDVWELTPEEFAKQQASVRSKMADRE